MSRIEVLDKVPLTSSKTKQLFGAIVATVITFLIAIVLFFLKSKSYWSICVWISGLVFTALWFPIVVIRIKHFTPLNPREIQKLNIEGFVLLSFGLTLQSLGVVIQN